MGEDRAVGGEQREPRLPLAIHIERLDAAQPVLPLAVLDLSQVESVAINNAPVGTAVLLRDAPVPVTLPVGKVRLGEAPGLAPATERYL